MLPNLKTFGMTVLVTIALCLSACAPSPSISSASPATVEGDVLEKPISSTLSLPALLKTSMGDFMIASARLADEVHGETPPAGEKILLVILTTPGLVNLDPGEFSLEAFSNMIHDPNAEIYVLTNDGSRIISTMAGWVQDEFALGFRVPNAEAYTLYWSGNAPIELNPDE